jgi:insertion element IS1 protein InsB
VLFFFKKPAEIEDEVHTGIYAMILEPLHCPTCNGTDGIKHGTSAAGKQRYRCQDSACEKKTFIRDYSYEAYLPQVKQKISDMAMNGSGIRDTARVLGISLNTVIDTLKKGPRPPSR